jgi:hypothetical protein
MSTKTPRTPGGAKLRFGFEVSIRARFRQSPGTMFAVSSADDSTPDAKAGIIGQAERFLTFLGIAPKNSLSEN